MPEIIIENLHGKVISFVKPARLLTILQENYIDWMHACGGKGRCTTCKLIVKEGMGALTPLSPFEAQCREKYMLSGDERLACQCAVKGDLIMKVPEETKLPHMDYSD